AEILVLLAVDEHPRVRVAALDALADQASSVDAAAMKSPLLANLGHADKRVRQAAGRLYSLVPAATFDDLAKVGPQAVLTATLALPVGPDTLPRSEEH